MMKRIAIAIAGALVLGSGMSRANDDKPPSSSSAGKTSSDQTSGTDSKATTSLPPTPDSAASQMAGDVKSADATAMVITIILPSGDEQQLNVAKDAQITRDGDAASLGQVREGDSVRASFDPTTHQASKLQVKSKGKSQKAKDSSPNPSDSTQRSDDKSQQK